MSSSSEIAALEADIKEYRQQLESVVDALHNDPGNAELEGLKSELDEAISVTQSAIEDLRPTTQPSRGQITPPIPVEEKWSKDKHPAFQPGYKRPGAPASPVEEAPVAVTLKVNDMVLAKWVTGDKAFYPARITSITGSSAAPVYNVTFKTYGNSDTLSRHDIKPILSDAKKRKADDTPAATISTSPIPRVNTGVISAPANINPDLAVKKEPSMVSDGPTRPAKVPRKVKANKELEAGKSKWQDFTNKGKFGKAKPLKKESMFRTGEGVNARVGFIGSGNTMRKDPTRSRHIYEPTQDAD